MTPIFKRNLIIAIIAAVVVLAGGTTAFILLQPEPVVEEERPIVEVDRPKPVVEEEVKVEPTWPLTGLPLSEEDKALAHNRPLSIKIENSYDARPQLGVGSADVVYETLTEGGITRFNCLFQSNIPSDVGPVRSARNSDVTLVPQYQGILYYSGANGLVLDQMSTAGLNVITEGNGYDTFYRVDYRYAPHNLYLNSANAKAAAEANGYTLTTESPSMLEFLKEGESNTVDGIKQAGSINIPFSDIFIAQWNWNSETKLYYRSMDGPTIDAADDSQIAVSNVVVMWSTFTPDPVGGTTLEVSLNGRGRAMIFTGGEWIEGTWETNGLTPPRFKDASGKPILLTPGQSWFSVLDESIAISAA